MVKPTTQSSERTSFHMVTLEAKLSDLIELFPNSYTSENTGEDKVNYDFVLETYEGGHVFTLYDWKYYRPLKMDEVVYWNVGGFSKQATEQGKKEILAALQTKERTL